MVGLLLLMGVKGRRRNKPSNTQYTTPITQHIQQSATEGKSKCKIQCSASDAKPNHTTVNPHRRSRNELFFG